MMSKKVCLIIGGGRGMGAATARQMHSRESNLALMSPSTSCETLATELGGISLRGRAEEEDWDKANEMVLKPVIRMAKLATPVMENQGGGSIVNITTFSAFEPSLTFPTSSVYRVGVSSFTKLYSDRYGPVNIRMNCLLPGFTDSLNLPQELAEMSSLKRLARADEQAKVAAFLLSDDSSYITGQSLRVDGGVTRHM